MTFSPMLLMEILFSVLILGFAISQVISLSPKRIAAEEAKKQAELEKASLEQTTSKETTSKKTPSKKTSSKKTSGHPEG